MSQPPTYDREFNFSDYQASSPSAPLPASHIDAELNRIKVTLDAILNNLGLIQRADGDLANASVGVDQLDTTISGGMSPPTKWLTATAYALNAVVWNAQKLYRCAIAHTSGTFSTDLAAAKWVELEDFTLSGVVNADSTTAGIVELATNAEAQAKSDTTRAITPSNLAALAASDTFAGLIELATDAEAVAASVTNRALTPANGAAAFGRTINKTTTETIQSDNTLSTDAALQFSMAANTKYHIKILVFFDTAAAADFVWGLTGPSSPTLVRTLLKEVAAGGGLTGGTFGSAATYTALKTVLGSGTTGGMVELDVLVHNGANAGTFGFQWCQNVSTAADTSVLAGSFLRYRIVA